MSIAPGFTNEQIREIVYEYDRQPYGTKTRWREDQGIPNNRMARWRRAVYDGNLDRGLIPRDNGAMTPSSQHQRRATAHSQEAKTRRIAELEKRIAELEQTNSTLEASNDALGKAIGLLHEISAHEPDDDQEPTTPYDS